MNSRDFTPRCLAWQRLLEHGKRTWKEEYRLLEKAGVVIKKNNSAVLKDPDQLADLLAGHCPETLEAARQAETEAAAMGITVSVTKHARESLALIRALRKCNAPSGPVWRQQLSAELFGDSKKINTTSILTRIFEQWLRTMPGRNEIRLKAFSPLPHCGGGPDLAEVTTFLGQAVLLPGHDDPEKYDMSRIHVAVTSENLAPFMDLAFPEGLLLYTGGFASRTLGHWLAALPKSCTWVHFGDFDPTGLSIFEALCGVSKKPGTFFPNLATLKGLAAELPKWKGSGRFNSEKHLLEPVRLLASWGAATGFMAEQEQISALLRAGGSGPDEIIMGLRRYSRQKGERKGTKGKMRKGTGE